MKSNMIQSSNNMQIPTLNVRRFEKLMYKGTYCRTKVKENYS